MEAINVNATLLVLDAPQNHSQTYDTQQVLVGSAIEFSYDNEKVLMDDLSTCPWSAWQASLGKWNSDRGKATNFRPKTSDCVLIVARLATSTGVVLGIRIDPEARSRA